MLDSILSWMSPPLDEVSDPQEMIPAYRLSGIEGHTYALLQGLGWDSGEPAHLGVVFVGKDPGHSLLAWLPAPRNVS